jgi:2,4'-dihydroxyacetophenone dioxygenase
MLLDMAKELEKTLHIYSDELPWIEMGNGLAERLLLVKENFSVSQLRAQPFATTNLHRHPTTTCIAGYTLKGAWGHDRQYLYKPGTLIFETPGVIHRFLNGPEETEVLFFGNFAAEYVNPETLETTVSITSHMSVTKYVERCEELGIKPRFLT